MDAFRIHVRGLIAGGLATALLSLPIDTRPARLALYKALGGGWEPMEMQP